MIYVYDTLFEVRSGQGCEVVAVITSRDEKAITINLVAKIVVRPSWRVY